MADFGKRIYSEDIAAFLGLPDSDAFIDGNELYLDDAYQAGYGNATDAGESEAEAVEAGQDAELEASGELYLQWEGAIEAAVQPLLEAHGMELSELQSGYMIAPTHSWRDAVAHIVNTINGVGDFWFESTKEFLDSGPYTPKQAVIAHLPYITLSPQVYGTSSPERLYEQAF
jgi:hypothetical protein